MHLEGLYPLYEDDQFNLPNEDEKAAEPKTSTKPSTDYVPIPYETHFIWHRLSAILIIHLGGLYGWWYLHQIQLPTLFFMIALNVYTMLGIEAGVHRLWSHRAFKASPGLGFFLAFAQTLTVEENIHEWTLDHRVHHKWSETDADPYNAKKGFVFSHIGWILINKHPEFERKSATIDMSDIESDPVLMFQKRFYWPLTISLNLIAIPTIPWLCWGESFCFALLTCSFLRIAYVHHVTFLVNSWAHMFGYRPYDKRIAPADTAIRHVQLGEGFHNYHHTFPWDYSAAELGPSQLYNPTTAFIDLCAFFGLVWDRKKVDPGQIQRHAEVHGEKVDRYRDVNGVYEWAGGLVTLFGPWFLSRWLLMACFG